MGFSSGKSKAKRKAKQAAAAQYIQAIRQAEFGGEAVPEIDQSGKRKIEREYRDTGMLGGRERRLAREADEVAQKANKVRGDYNAKLERYNQRKRIADAQLENRVAETADPKRLTAIDSELSKLRAEEAAYQARLPRSHQPMFSGMLRRRQQQPEFSQEQLARVQRMTELQNDRRLWDGKSYQRAQGYRELGGLEQAYKELAIMSKEAQGYKMKENPRHARLQASAQQDAAYRGLLGLNTRANQWGGGVNTAQRSASTFGTIGINPSFSAKAPDPNDMVLDPNSAAVQLKNKVSQYNGIAEKLKQNLQRKAAGGQVLAGSAQQADLAGGDLAGTNLDQERFA